ncbi:MAG: hypothetical protein IJB96_08995 [Lachnospira sp.]|nr:hypothetical protein [Lachnospira sp.]
MKVFNKYKFSDKSPTLGGTISTIMGVVALLTFIWGVFVAFQAKGYAGVEVGTYAIIAFLLSLLGLIIGLISFKEDDKFYLLSKVGSLLCGILLVLMVSIFLMGMGL